MPAEDEESRRLRRSMPKQFAPGGSSDGPIRRQAGVVLELFDTGACFLREIAVDYEYWEKRGWTRIELLLKETDVVAYRSRTLMFLAYCSLGEV
jgi:hypothetical protein